MSDGSLWGPFGRGMLGVGLWFILTAAVALELWFSPVCDGARGLGLDLDSSLKLQVPAGHVP